MKCPFCGSPAKYEVGFTAYKLGYAKVAQNKVTGHFNVELCESHSKSTKKEDLLGKGGWEAIQQSLLSKGKALLDSSTVELQFNQVA